jgi:predicted RNA methylase
MRHPSILCGVLIGATLSTTPTADQGDVAAVSRQRLSPIEPLPEVPPHLSFVPADVADRMLQLAGVGKGDVVYDLGCGNGRVAILAAKKYGARSVGVDIMPNV